MRRWWLKLGVVCALVLGAGPSVRAQSEEPPGERSLLPAPPPPVWPDAWLLPGARTLSAGLGVWWPLQEALNLRAGPALALRASVHPASALGLDLSGLGSLSATRDGGRGASWWMLSGGLSIHLAPRRVVPYLRTSAGAGGYSIGATRRVAPIELPRGRYRDRDVDFHFGLEAGVLLFLRPRLGLRLALAFQQSVGPGGTDGVPWTRCDAHGCETRRYDRFRSLALTVEVVQQVGGDDGDPDGDGLRHAADHCPQQAEDHDGFEDLDGCPDPDHDLDGILDEVDACPQQPERINGWEDEDGCPDELPPLPAPAPPASRPLRDPQHLATIWFPAGTAQLDESSRAVLALVVEGLAGLEVPLRLVGGASAEGEAGQNLLLSGDRAEATAARLRALGLPSARLEAVACGEVGPAYEPTARRVELWSGQEAPGCGTMGDPVSP